MDASVLKAIAYTDTDTNAVCSYTLLMMMTAVEKTTMILTSVRHTIEADGTVSCEGSKKGRSHHVHLLLAIIYLAFISWAFPTDSLGPPGLYVPGISGARVLRRHHFHDHLRGTIVSSLQSDRLTCALVPEK